MKKLSLLLFSTLLITLVSCHDPAKSRIYMDEGFKLMMVYGQYEKAEAALDKAIKYDKNNFEAYYYRGCAKVNATKYKEAIADFEKAVELNPGYADAYFNLGNTYFFMHDEDKACEYYKLAAQYGRPNLEDHLKRCN